MIWIKSVLVGIAAAIATSVVIVAILLTTLLWWADDGTGSGGIGAVSVGIIDLVFLPVVLAFAIGFWWSMRRQRTKSATLLH